MALGAEIIGKRERILGAVIDDFFDHAAGCGALEFVADGGVRQDCIGVPDGGEHLGIIRGRSGRNGGSQGSGLAFQLLAFFLEAGFVLAEFLQGVNLIFVGLPDAPLFDFQAGQSLLDQVGLTGLDGVGVGDIFVGYGSSFQDVLHRLQDGGLRPPGGDGAGTGVIAFGVFPALEGGRMFFGVVGAVVGEGGTADATIQQAGGPVGAGGGVPPAQGAVLPADAFLHIVKDVCDGRPGFVGTLKAVAIPFHDTLIKMILQDPADAAALKGVAALRSPAPVIAAAGDSGHIGAGVVGPEDVLHDLVLRLIDGEGLAVADGAVPQTGGGLVSVAQGFFGHAPQNLSGEIVGIVFIKPLDDGLDQAAEHPFHDGFRYAFDLHAAFFPQDSLVEGTFLLVSGKAGEFP